MPALSREYLFYSTFVLQMMKFTTKKTFSYYQKSHRLFYATFTQPSSTLFNNYFMSHLLSTFFKLRNFVC